MLGRILRSYDYCLAGIAACTATYSMLRAGWCLAAADIWFFCHLFIAIVEWVCFVWLVRELGESA